MPPLLCPTLVGRKAELDTIAALLRGPGGTAFDRYAGEWTMSGVHTGDRRACLRR